MKKRSVKLLTILLCGIALALISYILSEHNNYTTQELAKLAEKQLHKKELVAKNCLDSLTQLLKTTKPKNLFTKFNNDVVNLCKNENIAIYVYEHDSLCFWTDNQPAVDLFKYTTETNVQLIKIRNGWFEYINYKNTSAPEYSLVALIPIKSEYDFENKYLNNNFSQWLMLPSNTKLLSPVNYITHAIKSQFGPPLFEIYRSEGLYVNKTIANYATLLAMAALILLFLAAYMFLKYNIKHQTWFVFSFSVLCFVVRFIMIYFKVPQILYTTVLYDPQLYADANSFYFSYLGDIFINSLLLLIVSSLIFKLSIKFNTNLKKLFNVGWLLLIMITLSIQIKLLIYSLVNNSTISYNINELFSFNSYSLIGLSAIGFCVLAYYLLTEKFIIIVFQLYHIKRYMVVLFAGCVLLVVLVFQLSHVNYIEYLWPFMLLTISVVFRKFKATYNFINVGIVVLVTALIITTLFNKYEQFNKKQTFEAISISLTDRQDVVAENEFNKVSVAIKKDLRLKNLLSLLPLSSEQIEQSLRQIHFTGYFERYEIIMSLFKNDCTPVFIHLSPEYLNEDYFKEQIKNDGFQTICDDLYFIDKKKKSIKYVAKIDIEDLNKNPDKSYRLYIQLEPKLASNLGSFPDLLLDKSLENKLESKKISYAVYEFGKLLHTFGEYQYPLFINAHSFNNNQHDGFKHYIYSSQPNTTIIITDKEFGLWGKFTSNSYLFIFFSLLVLVAAWFSTIIKKRSLRFTSLNNKIQFILVSIVVLSLAGVVIGTIWVVNTQFENKNEKELILKSHSVLKELHQNIAQQEVLEPGYKDIITYRLKRLAQLFGSDISIFNTHGLLYATSQPALYDQGLVSKFMNPIAISNFSKNIQASYSHKEKIGSLTYLSAYIPFYNKNDKLLGYINLPYFSRQKDLEKELTAYLTTLINIYTILFAITTLIALLISNLLTKPLRIIKQQISNIQFGKYNEALQWKSKDEIGNLVAEYNNMLLKLEKSSELLAQSERESAWREMAKQVAHEIKNPLTPMKLNIQHLQRVVETHPDDINERVKRVSQMLIEQIDTLSHIATEFSNFAKFPNTNLQPVNLHDVLQNVTHLFQQNTICEIYLNASANLMVMADKEQCLRIFTNLLKNAEQSIPENRKGKIEIIAFSSEKYITIKVKDNGCGIPEDVKHKLFTPNFTTKTTGTGLGLAMVKNSVTSFNGTIVFETLINQGTTFTIVFPVIKKQS